MFLHLSVILFAEEVCLLHCMLGYTFLLADTPHTMGYGQQAGGTHPTEMHTCCFMV